MSLDLPDITTFRAAIDASAAPLATLLANIPPNIKSTTLTYPTRDGAQVPAHLVQPTNPSPKGSPLIILIHGGGWSSGSASVAEFSARPLTQAYSAVCLAITHRLSPEHPFPTPVNDCWDALQFALAHAAEWGADPAGAGFIVTGSSSGANLAAALTLMSLDQNLSPPITGQNLVIPHLIPLNTPPPEHAELYLSWDQNATAPFFPRGPCLMLLDCYKPDTQDWRYTPYAYPGGVPSNQPKTAFQVCGLDPLRDDALIYEKTLRQKGVETRLWMYEGLPHSGWSAWPGLEVSQRYYREHVEVFGWLLGREADLGAVVM